MTSLVESVLKATALTRPSWPAALDKTAPVAASNISSTPLTRPTASKRSSGLNAAQLRLVIGGQCGNQGTGPLNETKLAGQLPLAAHRPAASQARQIFRDLIHISADVQVRGKEVSVSFDWRAHLPLILASGLMEKPVPVPGWNGLPLRVTTYEGPANKPKTWVISFPWKSRLARSRFCTRAGRLYRCRCRPRRSAWEHEVLEFRHRV